MSANLYQAAKKPTFYFIGVTTQKSSIMSLFPKWAEFLNLGDCEIKGLDFKPHDQPQAYQECVRFIKNDPLSLGALVTTHKIDLLTACREQFDWLDPNAQLMGEISCISKRKNKLIGHAKDPISSGLAMDAFIPENHWTNSGGEVMAMGAGGSTIAITSYLVESKHKNNLPAKIIVTNRSQPRLDEIERIHSLIKMPVPVEYHLCPHPKDNDAVAAALKSHSMVINATGLGKDVPGSPFTNQVQFPENGLVWELNYRGDLVFLDQAENKKNTKNLLIEDGWTYFIHGWTQVIAEVFQIEIPTQGAKFNQLCQIAESIKNK
jgi:shikimate 5-dehydrogenase